MASIQKRTKQDGQISYRVQVRLRGYQAERATFTRLTDARKWAQSTEVAMRERRYFKTSESQKHTVHDMIGRYLEKIQRENPKRLKDVQTILTWWDNQLGFCVLADFNRSLISKKVELLTKKTVERVNKGTQIKQAVPISASRVNRYIAALSHVCTIAVNEWEWLENNPVSKIKKLPEPRGRMRFLSDDERKALLEASKHASYQHMYLIIVLAVSTGMRRSEIMHLRWPDIDFQRQQIVIHDTKNDERRVIPLCGHAYELIQAHCKIRRLDTDFLFPSKKGDKPYETKRSWEGALAKAEVEDFRFHDLRHTAASYLAMNGASLIELAEILGHKTLQMVKRYAHLSEAHTSTLVANMNERIFGS